MQYFTHVVTLNKQEWAGLIGIDHVYAYGSSYHFIDETDS